MAKIVFSQDLLGGLVNAFVPAIIDLVLQHRQATGVDPTSEEVLAAFHRNLDRYLAEGAAWRAAHPTP
jgi:hypothetical protein